MLRFLVFTLFVFICSFSPLKAQEVKSAYSEIDLKICPLVDQAQEGDGEWAIFRCEGVAGLAVFVSEADLRFSLGYGPDGRNQKSIHQFLGPFNTVGKTLEWRLREGRPIASILRYFTETGTGGDKGQVLVISKVSRGASCHVAYVDSLANKDANELARFAADHIAENFDCERDHPIRIGKRGVSPF